MGPTLCLAPLQVSEAVSRRVRLAADNEVLSVPRGDFYAPWCFSPALGAFKGDPTTPDFVISAASVSMASGRSSGVGLRCAWPTSASSYRRGASFESRVEQFTSALQDMSRLADHVERDFVQRHADLAACADMSACLHV